DQAEDVVPSPSVEAAGVVSELIENFLHLEGRREGFDQHRAPDRPPRNRERVLGEVEGVVPQARFQVALDFWQVEVGAGVALAESADIVEEVKPKVEEAGGDRLAIDEDMSLRQVPTSRAHQQGGDLLVESVLLALGAGEGEGPPDRVDQVELPLHHV